MDTQKDQDNLRDSANISSARDGEDITVKELLIQIRQQQVVITELLDYICWPLENQTPFPATSTQIIPTLQIVIVTCNIDILCCPWIRGLSGNYVAMNLEIWTQSGKSPNSGQPLNADCTARQVHVCIFDLSDGLSIFQFLSARQHLKQRFIVHLIFLVSAIPRHEMNPKDLSTAWRGVDFTVPYTHTPSFSVGDLFQSTYRRLFDIIKSSPIVENDFIVDFAQAGFKDHSLLISNRVHGD
ncbi:hypothetical protein MIR68_002084 [Amoeboaphelidium protococcarum]|nr:hypothetical protein MIR68_002084 [Amoeboaphelidium protococcarum]